MKAVHLIEDDHIEWRGGCSLLFVTANMHIAMVCAPISEPMNEPWVSMKRKDDRLVLGEERIEVMITQSLWMLTVGLECHEVYDIDHANFQFGQVAAEQIDRGERLERRHIAAARHDHIRFPAFVVAGEFPDASARCAMLDRIVHA